MLRWFSLRSSKCSTSKCNRDSYNRHSKENKLHPTERETCSRQELALPTNSEPNKFMTQWQPQHRVKQVYVRIQWKGYWTKSLVVQVTVLTKWKRLQLMPRMLIKLAKTWVQTSKKWLQISPTFLYSNLIWSTVFSQPKLLLLLRLFQLL